MDSKVSEALVERVQSSREELDYIASHENTPLAVALAAKRASELLEALSRHTVEDDGPKLRELLQMWRNLVQEGGIPRYTVLPGAALNTLVTWTDAALTNTSDEGVLP